MMDKYNTMKFVDVWDDSEDFKNEYLSCPLSVSGWTLHHGETVGTKTYNDNVTLLFALLYARYGNSPIPNLDVNQWKMKVFSTIFEHGTLWEKEMEIQEKLRGLTEDEIMLGAKSIYNHAYNDGTAPGTGTLDELNYINDQNTATNKKSKMGAYGELLFLLNGNVTNNFLLKFKKLFSVVVAPQFGPRIFSDYEEEDED